MMTMPSFSPAAALARTGLYRKQLAMPATAQFIACGEGAIAGAYHGDEQAQARRCGLVDLTPLARTGFRGNNAAAHLQNAGWPVPAQPNQLAQTAAGELVLRLSQREFWVLGALADAGAAIDVLNAAPRPDTACYPLFCRDSHAWLLLSGEHCAAVMAKLCGVDLRVAAFAEGSIAQTSVARINAIIASHRVNGVPAFSILCDSGYLSYLWDVLLDAMDEFGGAPVGTQSLMPGA